MKLPPLPSLALALALTIAFCLSPADAAGVTSPKDHFGFAIGDDYQLANYTQTEAYFKKIATESPRARLVDIGRTEEGRTQWMLVFSAPENLARLDHYKAISGRLARAEGLSPDEARALAAEGRAIVWIDGGLHATETVGTHQLIETAWQLASATDPETLRILRDTIVLLVHANPDGQELVSNWYMREKEPTKRTLSGVPRLYQKYIGHDNNRDFHLSAMKESTNLNRQLYLEWFPQILYNHHQSGPAGTILFVPPFRDPFNYVFDPMVVVGVEALGNAMQRRFLQEDKPGATSRSGANYSTWWNGGLRTTAYFHNMIGLLTEIVGSPTPMTIPMVARRQLPSGDLTYPVPPQDWHFRQSIEYSVSANRAILDYASRHREDLLHNFYRMGRNSIERGGRDHWTPRPSRIEEISRLAAEERRTGPAAGATADTAEAPAASEPRLPQKYYDLLRKPEWRDPRGFILPADQPDFPTAIKFINSLIKTGIAVHRATDGFTVAGKRYPKGTYVVKTDQAFRPHVLDMFEPQDHPHDFRYEGGPPIKPYDVAGWTLAFQMGIAFDRILDGFDGPFERLPYGQLQAPPPGKVDAQATGLLVSHRTNDTFILANRLLKAGIRLHRLEQPPAEAPDMGPGALYVSNEPAARALVTRTAEQLGLTIRSTKGPPGGKMLELAPVRIGLWDRYGGSMPSGWIRWILEQFEFPFDVVFTPAIDAGNLRERYDILILPGGAVPAPGARIPGISRPDNLPPEYEGRIGRITPDTTIPRLREFAGAGGTIVAIGSSTNLAAQLNLPVRSALVEKLPDGSTRALPEEKFYIPGSVLEARVNASHPLAWGMPSPAHVYFDRSPAWVLPPDAHERGIQPILWYEGNAPLRSGWAWGQHHLNGSVGAVSVPLGRGRIHLMGCEVTFRAQTHGTFKLLFNALHLATARQTAPIRSDSTGNRQ